MDSEAAEDDEGVSETVIIGSYQLLAIRSRLANCQTWTALHRPTEMEVVVEVYPKTGDDKALIESIVLKINRFAQLAECRVLRLLEAIDLDSAILLVHEYYSSQSLMQYAMNCPVNGSEFRRLVRSLIRIVQRLHSKFFFHGTLSLDSFVLTKQKKIKFKDAASCHLFVRSDVEPSRFDAILSKSTDIWSLGTLIYRLISHQLDTAGTHLPSLMDELRAGQTGVARVVRAMNSDLSDLLTRMTDQNPAARISTTDCLRHPYLTQGDPLAAAAAARLNAPSSTLSVNRDVLRFLSRATGAPEEELAASAVANDLSGWCAAYWLLRQRFLAGRGFPELAQEDETSELLKNADEDKEIGEPQNESSSQSADARSSPQSKPQSQKHHQQHHRSTIQVLRTRRLGLQSPQPSSRPLAAVSQGAAAVAATFRTTGRSRDEPLPPIGVRSASQSQRSSQGQQQQQQTLIKQATDATTRRYLVYMRNNEVIPVSQSAAKPGKTDLPPISPRVEANASSAIRVRVQTRSTQERPARPWPNEDFQQQQQQTRQAIPMPSPRDAEPQQQQPPRQSTMLSPRQPPNSRVDVGRPGEIRRIAADKAAADSAAAAAAVGPVVAPELPEADHAAVAGTDEHPPPFVWHNAVVRWPQWMQSRVA